MSLMLYLIRGLPGSGKSTLAQTLPAKHIEADMYFVNRRGKYQFDPKKLPQAHAWCQQQARNLLREGKSVVVSNTFVEHWEMKAYLDLADEFDAKVEVVVCRGEYENIHGVPAENIEKMRARWQD